MAHPEFDDSVFEGVEGDDGDAAVGEEAGRGGGEGALEAAEFVVDGDAEGLEGFDGWVLAAFFGDDRGDDVGEFGGGGERLGVAVADDGGGDAAGGVFFAEAVERVSDFGFRP